MIETRALGRDYSRGERTLTVLNNVSFTVSDGEFVSITGPSGSGKSTLLGLLAGLDRPSRGSVSLDGQNLNDLNETELSRFRGSRVGFVFQNFQLVPTLTALENVSLPLRLQDQSDGDERARQMLDRVGLGDRLNHYPTQLSGGEMQRVAIARASVISPRILFADEPTGNLDSISGDRVIEMLTEMHGKCTLVLVTHNPGLASLADREIRLRDGEIESVVVHRKPKPGKATKKGKSRKSGTGAAGSRAKSGSGSNGRTGGARSSKGSGKNGRSGSSAGNSGKVAGKKRTAGSSSANGRASKKKAAR